MKKIYKIGSIGVFGLVAFGLCAVAFGIGAFELVAFGLRAVVVSWTT